LSRYHNAVQEIDAIIHQLEKRETIDDKPPFLNIDVEVMGYEAAAELAEKVLQHLRETLAVLTSTDENSFAPTDEELERVGSSN